MSQSYVLFEIRIAIAGEAHLKVSQGGAERGETVVGARIWIAIITLINFAAVAMADQLFLKNGDRVSGVIIKKDGATISIKTENFGVIAAPWEQVEAIQSATVLTVVLQDGSAEQGTLVTAGGKVELTGAGAGLHFALGEVATIRNAEQQRDYERLLKQGWLSLWTGEVNTGLAGTAGNAKTQTLSTSFKAARRTSTDKTEVSLSAIKASAQVNGETSDTAEAIRGGFTYNHNVSSRFFINTFNNYEYDRFQNLDLRASFGGGFGYTALRGARRRLEVVGGVAYSHEKFSLPSTRNSAESYVGNDFHFQLNGVTSVFQTFRLYSNLTDGSLYRANADIGATTKLNKWLNWNVSISDRYLNTPSEGRKRNDFLYTTGIGVVFTR